MRIENAAITNRSLGDSERAELSATAHKITELRSQRTSASAAKAAQIDREMRKLNERCETIIGAQ